MSRLEELIRELCPNGVEMYCIKDIAEVGTGSSNGNESEEDGAYPFFIRSQTIKSKNTYEYEEEAIIIPGEGGVGDIYHYVCGRYALHQRVYRIHFTNDKINTKYAYHYFQAYFKRFIMKKAVSATVTSIRKPMIQDFVIPVPPLEVQREIVRILDNFTELAAELAAELTARKQQYQYYLNCFFETQTDNLVPLESIGTLTRGKRFVHADATDTGVPCIHYGELYTYYGVHASAVKSHIREDLRPKMRYAHKGDVIIVGAGENNIDIGVGVAWEGNEDVAVHDACYTLKHSQNSKYISYYLRSDMYHSQIKKYVSEGKICSISAAGLGKAMIPIPSLSEQQRIVSILERFDVLCNDITTGLPAEIEARQKQYEYYRDKLLSFE